MTGRLYLLALVALFSVKTASATPIFSWSLSPTTQIISAGTSEMESFTATITNNGGSDITGLYGLSAYVGTIAPFASGYLGTAGSGALLTTLTGIDIKPGASFSFVLATLFLTDAPAGSYTFFDDRTMLALTDSTGHSAHLSPGNNPLLTVLPTPAPEPSSLILLGTGALGLLAMTKRRFLHV
jgi:hypothetical protein